MNTIIHQKLLLSLLSGLFIGLSYPPLPLGFFAWFGLIPLFLSLEGSDYKESLKYADLRNNFKNKLVEILKEKNE